MRKEIAKEELHTLPEATNSCGISLDDPELDEWFSRLAGAGQEEEKEWPPQGEDDCSDFSYDSEGFLKVAGDGACPNGQGDLRLRGSGAGVYYGRGSNHNPVTPIKRAAQGAQRGEVRAAFAMGLVGLEQNSLHHGVSASQRRNRSDFQEEKRKQKSHRDLWKRVTADLQAKGLTNHKVEKVKAHQSKKQKEDETEKEASLRKRNDGADKRAVEAAAKNAASSQLAKRGKKWSKLEG